MHDPASTWSSHTLLCVELTTVALLPPSPPPKTYTHLTLSCCSPSVWSCSERTSGFAKWYADCSRERQHTSIHIHTTHTHTTYPRPHISPISVLRSYSRTIPRSGPSGRRSEIGNSRSAYGYPDLRVRSPHVPFARAAGDCQWKKLFVASNRPCARGIRSLFVRLRSRRLLRQTRQKSIRKYPLEVCSLCVNPLQTFDFEPDMA